MSTLTTPHLHQDCKDLFQALKGIKCDEKKVIEILSHRNYTQRRQICKLYKEMFDQDLLHRLKWKLHSKLEKAILLWMYDAVEQDATILMDALRSWGVVDTRAILEVFCTKKLSEVKEIAHIYKAKSGRSLEEDISSKTSGNLTKLLLAYLSELRPDTREVDIELAKSDAKSLYKAGEFRVGTDETTIMQILTTRNEAHLTATFDVYKLLYNRDLLTVMKEESSGELQHALRAIIKRIQKPAKYFAKILYKSMKGFGTDDPTLTRVVVTRAEIDMQNIKDEFVRKYKKSLENMVASDTMGNYKLFLLSLIGSHQH